METREEAGASRAINSRATSTLVLRAESPIRRRTDTRNLAPVQNNQIRALPGYSLFLRHLFLVVDSGTGLLKAEHPPIGAVQLFGTTIWLGWLMIAVMAVTSVPPVILGRLKMRLAKDLHNKVLYADADMNKADWMTGAGSIVGIAGIGIGLWWADAAAALFPATRAPRGALIADVSMFF